MNLESFASDVYLIAKKKYRIVYRLIGEHIEVIEIIGIGKRDKAEVYKIIAKRLKKCYAKMIMSYLAKVEMS